MVLSSLFDWELVFVYYLLKIKKIQNWVYFSDFFCIGMEQVWKGFFYYSLYIQVYNFCYEL